MTVFRHSSFLRLPENVWTRVVFVWQRARRSTRSKAQLGQASGSKAPPSAGSKALPSRPGSTAEPQASARGRRPTTPATPSPKPRSLRLPPPSGQPLQSPSSSYASASPSIPPTGKWTVAGFRQALSNSEVKFSRKMSKAQFLFVFFLTLRFSGKHQYTHLKKVSKARKTRNYHVSPTSSSRSSSGSPRASSSVANYFQWKVAKVCSKSH